MGQSAEGRTIESTTELRTRASVLPELLGDPCPCSARCVVGRSCVPIAGLPSWVLRRPSAIRDKIRPMRIPVTCFPFFRIQKHAKQMPNRLCAYCWSDARSSRLNFAQVGQVRSSLGQLRPRSAEPGPGLVKIGRTWAIHPPKLVERGPEVTNIWQDLVRTGAALASGTCLGDFCACPCSKTS